MDAIRARGWGQGLKVRHSIAGKCQPQPPSGSYAATQLESQVDAVQAPAAGSLAAEAIAAASRVYQVISQTRIIPDDWLSHESGCKVLLKLENEQVGNTNKSCCVSLDASASTDSCSV